MTLSSFMVNLSDYDINPTEIAHGNFGSVSEGWEKKTRRHVAIKTIKNASSTAKENTDLVRELSLLAQIRHPACLNLLGFTRAASDGHNPIIITPFMANGTLESALKAIFEGHPIKEFTPTKMTCSLYGICSAMTYLHSKGIIHRDFKPANIFLDDNYEIYVADFGVSRKQADVNMTMIVGSPIYMAPEMYSDDYDDKYSTQVDVYSFGVSLCLYFTKSPTQLDDKKGPIKSPQNLMMRIMKGARLARPEKAPDNFWEIIQSCFKTDPAERPTFSFLIELFENDKNYWFEGTDEAEYRAYIQKIKDGVDKITDPELLELMKTPGGGSTPTSLTTSGTGFGSSGTGFGSSGTGFGSSGKGFGSSGKGFGEKKKHKKY
ncbi:hypothetical protein TRFO_15612 [Tritrichomonas foetus]|uniref:Protein kinase domain-containing protein n=1 Tax=Tritrichomonas foetus TaxID=1144522 RepID=A0A1J4KS13_9EUKA|nr:hypothetical protein TRFO_15612 [Tritrichomonas foetus]|eukprot:OHT14081.1 hypothetical protein TRFO_15612 [Tritrichomonas foetus]